MRDWQDIFATTGPDAGPGDDFESRVFAKIRRKKVQRKAGLAAAAAGTAAVALLALFHSFPTAVGRNGLTAGKVEVPVSEHLYFATSDSRTRYTLQPVALRDGAEPQAAVNQI